tara:strand:+ start:7940 stop:9124 length:1185 start_codon:yes stop_codon:yes gene_type:complete
MVTLDNIHHNKIDEIKNKKMEDYLEILKNLKEQKAKYLLDTSSNNSGAIMNLSETIADTEKNIEMIKTNGFMKDYYLEAGDILFKYYEGVENVETTKTNASPTDGGILSYLGTSEDEDKDGGAASRGGDTQSSSFIEEMEFLGGPASREDLRNLYLKRIDVKDVSNNTKKSISKLKAEPNICSNCKTELSHIHAEGIVECQSCGELFNIINDTDRASYKDPPKESCYYSYRRSNHFNEWIAQFQGKETTQIPRNVLVQVVNEIKKERIHNLNELSTQKVRSILKKLKLNKYYEHIPHIINQLNGQPPPYMSRQTEEVLRIMFQKIQGPFLEFCPKKRKNFLSYSYVLHKFVELLGMDELKPLFPLLKSREKLASQDMIWKKICERVGWHFYKSI